MILLDSEVCGADLHHYPCQHVGLHAPQRLHCVPRTVSVVVRSERVPAVVVVLTGHRLGGGQSVEPLVGRFVDASTRLQDEWDEVVLGTRRFDRYVAPVPAPGWCRCPGRRSAGSRGTQRRSRGPTCCRTC
jgi:hypothetical protein